MHFRIFHHRLCLHWTKIEKLEKSDFRRVWCRSSKQKKKTTEKKTFTMFRIPNSLRISTDSRNEVVGTGSPHSCECSHRMNMTEYLRTDSALPHRDSIINGSRKESALSPQSLFSSDGEYISPSLKNYQESAKGNFLTELSGESNFHELPDSSRLPELSEDSLNHDQSTPVAGHSFLNNQKRISSTLRAIVSPSSASNGRFQSLDTPEAGSTFITEFPCVNGDQVGYRTQWYIGTQESTPSAGHYLSDTLGSGNSEEAEMVDITAEIRIQMDAACLSPDSSIPMPLQSPRFRGSMCPAIQTDVRRFESNLDAIQRQGRLFEDSPQISSPDTASTNASGETFPSDSGYGPRAPQSDYTSATSPRSLFSGDERLGFENTFFSKAGQLVSPSEFSHERYFDQSCSLQSKQPNDSNWLGLETVRYELDNFCRDQHMQVSCLSDFNENILESGEMGVLNDPLTAYVAQSVTDIDQRLSNNLHTNDAAQYLQSTIQCGVDCLKSITPRAEKCATTGAAAFTPGMETEYQYAPSLFGTYEEKYASPWSAEHVRGSNKNFNFVTIPETQLQIEEEQARASNYDTPSPKSATKVIKCPHPGCNYEPGGADQWKLGNLRRHEKERHKITLKDRVVCKMRDCKATFTRVGNRNAHLENMHGAVIFRQKRNRRNSMAENAKQPRAASRITKAPRKIGGLPNRTKHSRSQSVPELLKSTEF
ncbi:putative transcription factor c2h2 protein [Botrytis fragariae]|uniref:Putative transcription factor c2h2 protein n=1 Tax=Botrytis fragariae TaxID=1964551 RepID=A0A8H6ELT2_9HELO|nr:putative transcription factor c2h2 protein [Botrytis fragariae]KAF5877006.1 putative transcription factor c2h2 protein [Botrytis fragariae]